MTADFKFGQRKLRGGVPTKAKKNGKSNWSSHGFDSGNSVHFPRKFQDFVGLGKIWHFFRFFYHREYYYTIVKYFISENILMKTYLYESPSEKHTYCSKTYLCFLGAADDFLKMCIIDEEKTLDSIQNLHIICIANRQNFRLRRLKIYL